MLGIDHQWSLPAASHLLWVVDLDYFTADQKWLVLQECIRHSGGALVVTRGSVTRSELVERLEGRALLT
eukprot:1923020-Rhodomonas_salina.1